VIPADAREELGIAPGDRLYVIGSPMAGAVTFIKEEQLEEFIERINAKLPQFDELKSAIKANRAHNANQEKEE